MADLIMFYGEECVHCRAMEPLIEKLEKEMEVKVERLEIWHNSKNKKIYDDVNTGIKCTGVPFFYNKKNNKVICGAVLYEELKKWAK